MLCPHLGGHARGVCREVGERGYRGGVGRVVVWGVLTLAVVGGVWVGRTTIVGAVAAVVGRERLGVVGEGLLEAGEVGGGKMG